MCQGELRRSLAASLFARGYGVLGCRRRVMNAVLRLEGGAMFSATGRALLREHQGVSVGAYSYGECFVPGVFPAGVTVGRYVSIAEGVRVFLRNHPLERRSMHPFFYNSQFGIVGTDTITSGSLVIGDDAWIGCRAILTPGCARIGIGAVVAAGAVVTNDVPDFCIAAGVPARVVRQRFSDTVCNHLLEEAWWTRSIEEVRSDLERFLSPLDSNAFICTRKPRD